MTTVWFEVREESVLNVDDGDDDDDEGMERKIYKVYNNYIIICVVSFSIRFTGNKKI
jgi:hypothetical protein